MFSYRIGPFVRISAILFFRFFKARLSGPTAQQFQYRRYFEGPVK